MLDLKHVKNINLTYVKLPIKLLQDVRWQRRKTSKVSRDAPAECSAGASRLTELVFT